MIDHQSFTLTLEADIIDCLRQGKKTACIQKEFLVLAGQTRVAEKSRSLAIYSFKETMKTT
jgi:hypothetical protein